jgi:hypothetical protein
MKKNISIKIKINHFEKEKNKKMVTWITFNLFNRYGIKIREVKRKSKILLINRNSLIITI